MIFHDPDWWEFLIFDIAIYSPVYISRHQWLGSNGQGSSYRPLQGLLHALLNICVIYIHTTHCKLTWLVDMKHLGNHHIFADSSPAVAGHNKDPLDNCLECWQTHWTLPSWSLKEYRVKIVAVGMEVAGSH